MKTKSMNPIILLIILLGYTTLPANEGNYVIITEPQYVDAHSFQQFVDWRKNRFDVTVKTIDEIGNSQEEIESFIKEMHVTNQDTIKYLLFVGTPWGENGIAYDTNMIGIESYPTYTTYGQINKQQALDNYFSDPTKPYVRPRMEISVGVFPIRDVEALDNIVAKTMYTESGIDQYPSDVTVFGSSYEAGFNLNVQNSMANWSTQLPEVIIHDLYPGTPSDLISLVNQEKSKLITYYGHGLHESWHMEGGSFTKENISQLENTSVFPMIISGSCLTASFVDSNNSLGADWMGSANGASVYVGNIHTIALTATYDYMEALPRYYKDQSIRNIGDLVETLRDSVLYYHSMASMYEFPGIFGDPALNFRGDFSGSAQITTKSSIEVSNHKINLRHLDQNTLSITLSQSNDWRAKVISISGREVFSSNLDVASGESTITLPVLTSGVYFFVVSSDTEKHSFVIRY
ncbi:C25 family cysteine peptidase [bacterium]|nr:C25 family cysteine peptidase [bacterium]